MNMSLPSPPPPKIILSSENNARGLKCLVKDAQKLVHRHVEDFVKNTLPIFELMFDVVPVDYISCIGVVPCLDSFRIYIQHMLL